jgi:MoxR-like ATPase
MSTYDLVGDSGLRNAVEAIGNSSTWTEPAQQWIRDLAETIRWVRSTDETQRGTREFQKRLWDDNHVAAIGQGNISIDRALDDADFRRRFAERSMAPLPVSMEERLRFLTALYQDLRKQLEPFVRSVPHLKIFRVLAALYPEAMTTVASMGPLAKLASAMDSDRTLDSAGRHVWVRHRLDSLLGDTGSNPLALAERMALPWLLYERFVQPPPDLRTEEETVPGSETRLLPLNAARRRRGLTAIRGLFPGLLSALEFVRDGVTRDELIDFLRISAPDSKVSSLGVTINVFKSELGAIKLDGDRYVLTERGENVLESQDPSDLADWLLTRVLGVDNAIMALRNQGPMSASGLTAFLRTVNPGWTSDFAPQAILGWLRSMGVIHTEGSMQVLTDVGRQWASLIHWQPESLPPDPLPPDPGLPPIGVEPPNISAEIALPTLAEIVTYVQSAGHFPAPLIACLHASLWAHPRRHFAILTGLSGSGKTLLARRYASALIQSGSEKQLFTLPVQPGWYDPGALLGFTNPLRNDSYVRTTFLEFLMAAAADLTRPYIVVLDEMNLSHPEQYMAPLLSAMETGDAIQLHTEDEIFDGIPREIRYPRNLVLIGTVNMDETTHGLSDKVLDRAFVHEFWNIDLEAYPRWGTRKIDPAHEKRTRDILTSLMKGLSPARLHFGWRVVDDVLDFLSRAATAGGDLSFESALDSVVNAKVLPKLRGEDTARLREALRVCEEALATAGLEGSRAKIAELREDLRTTGSARFWR